MDSLVTIKADAELLAARLEKLENGMDSYEQIKLDAIALSSRIAAMENASAGAHSHFESLLNHPNLHAQWTLRDNSHYLGIRGSRGLFYTGGVNPGVNYDTNIDGAKVVVPPLSNELSPEANNNQRVGQFMCWWNRPSWNTGGKLVVQYEMMISQMMHDRIPDIGTNGRRTNGFKFVNLCRGTSAITYELRTEFLVDPVDTLVDVRSYGIGLATASLEGVIRDNMAGPSPIAAYDSHPGPDSDRPYNHNPQHPAQFRIRSHRWVRVTCEMERVIEGTRFKMWLADDDTDPKLVIASPSNPSLGFLTSVVDPIEAWFCQLDTSQETTYATPQPERWCAFRNMAVLSNVDGSSVLGGRTK